MKIIIVLILSIFFYPSLTTQDSTVVENQIICNIAGSVWTSTYVFDINQLPERCNIITIGQYAFDRDDGTNTRIMESDKDVIRTLIEANKPVYTRIGFVYKDDWSSIFDPPDADVFQTEIFDPLVNFLNTIKVNGLLINCEFIYNNVDIDDFAQKMSNFVTAIKEKVDKLIVGLIISGWYYESFSDNTLFDFSITNKALDLYIINWSILNDCEEDKDKTGMTPITSTTPNTTTIEQVTCAVSNSDMDKSKIYAMIQMLPVIPKNLVPEGEKRISTYSIFCASGQADSSQWCTNPPKLSYDQGAYAKTFYVGIVLQQLDTDDYESKCECGPFPVSNVIIDGWTGCPFNDCPKLDRS
ncbi:uncharacterized protein LOC100569633 isoform X1 [Acyrthosiphon pisum]|uniref:Uncharacterized protein n=1 Tax=Acyrthosiphon pisum TaxID=7029 RepID=A0A8R1W7C2_ACYPI|nr:uncharacterized protein LOC100569633 isoform X1 [Acyrthosiphon pisum]|eukprot:XP_003246843.3 PREDICTED: uncharacterized protein LOC100569633 [Acyrthosiphon pisum]